MKNKIKYYLQKLLGLILDEPVFLKGKVTGYSLVKSERSNVLIAEHTKIAVPFYLKDIVLGEYSYIAKNSNITNTEIGKFTLQTESVLHLCFTLMQSKMEPH